MNPDKNIIFAPTSPDESLSVNSSSRFFSRLFKVFVFCFFVSRFAFDVSPVFSQQPTQQWVRRYTDTSSSYWGGMSIKTDSLGFIYVLTGGDYGFGFLKYNSTGNLLTAAYYNPVGYINSSIAFDVNPLGDVYITGRISISFNSYMSTVKFNSNGVFQWWKLYGAPNTSAPSDLKIDKEGNIIVVGGATVKYNPGGDTLWTRRFASSQKMILDDSNNIYITGYSALKCFVQKYNTFGSLEWYTTFTLDSNRSHIGSGISIDQNGNIYVLGTSSVAFAGLNEYLIKLSNNGTIVWNRVFTGIINGEQGGCYISVGPVITNDNNSVCFAANCDNGTGGGGFSIATIKYSSFGDSEWVKVFNGGGVAATSNIPASIKLDKYNNIYVCGSGYYQSTGDDYVTIKYSPTGTQNWIETYSGEITNNGDYSQDLIIDTNLNVYVTGNSPNLFNGRDAVTIKYSQPNGVQQISSITPVRYDLSQNYPNPFNPNTKFRFEMPKAETVKITVYDILGREVEKLLNENVKPGSYKVNWDAGNYSSGIYFYSLVAGSYREIKKAVLIK
jgi:hypothetical protein